MKNAELIDLFRNVERSNHPVCNGCPLKYTCDKNQMTHCLFGTVADALESISKTVIPHRNYEMCNIYWCDCGWFLKNKDQTPNYCPNCGKRIEWKMMEVEQNDERSLQ